MLKPIGFWSYARDDDSHSDGQLSQLRAIVGKQINLKYGAEVMLWQDIAAIPFGADWKKTINQTIGQTTFFIPIITPRFLKSKYCLDEFLEFRRRMLALERDDLIFPVHYINVDSMQAGETEFGDDLAFLRRQQWIDFRLLQYSDSKSPEVRKWAGSLADSILDAMRRAEPAAGPDVKAQADAEKAEREAAGKRQAEGERIRREKEDATRRAAEESARAEDKRREEERRKTRESEARRIEEERRNAAEAERREEAQRAAQERGDVGPAPVPPKSNAGLIAALALGAAGALGGGWYALTPAPKVEAPSWVEAPAAMTQQREFAEAMASESTDKLDAFVAKNPDSPLVPLAKSERERKRQSPTKPDASQPAAVAAPLSALAESSLRPGDEFRECDTCQPMVVVPAGSFTMGSPTTEEGRYNNEGPQLHVRIAKPFAVGKFPVTVDEFRAFVNATGYDAGSSCYSWDGSSWKLTQGRSWRDAGFKQTGSHPAACLNWNDAQAYVAWLKEKTGRPYRLLSEAEWEYSARGKTTTPYWWGSSISPSQANYGQNNKETVPVTSYAANPFGLYNMLGNVWQWIEDCYHEKYDGAPKDGAAWTTGDCSRRVLRGASWSDVPSLLRAANRSWTDPDNRYANIGFRLARTLNP